MAYIVRRNEKTMRLKPYRGRWRYSGYLSALIFGAFAILKLTSGYLFSDHPKYGIIPESKQKYLVETKYPPPLPLSEKQIVTAEQLSRQTIRVTKKDSDEEEKFFLVEVDDDFFVEKKSKQGTL